MYIRIEIYMTASSTLRKAEGDRLTHCYTAKPLHPPALIGLAKIGRCRSTRAEVLLTGVQGSADGICKILNAGELFNTSSMHSKNLSVICNNAGIFAAI